MTPRDPVATLGGQCFGCYGRLAKDGAGFDGDDANSAFGKEFEARVAATFGLFVILFGHHGCSKANQRGLLHR
jgi:hypothetical protein